VNVDDLVAIDMHVHGEVVADGHPALPERLMAASARYFNRCRRTVRDYERLPAHHAAMVQWAMVIIMTRRLAHHRRCGRLPVAGAA
jgi:hypothetical protein